MIEVGFSATDITPTTGSTIPGGFAPRISSGIQDPLQATACVIRDQNNTVAVIGLDMVSLSRITADRIRATIAAAIGISEQNIIVAASHTHGGGPSIDVLGSEANEEYLELCVERVCEAAIDAHLKLQPAECAHAVGQCQGWSFNRRFKMRDGSEATQPAKGSPDIIASAGPIDHELGVIAFRTRDGMPLGAIACFACHPTVIWGDKFTGDFPAYWRSSLRKKTHPNFELIFLNGACGNIGPSDYANSTVREGGVDWAGKMGQALADETARLMELADYADSVGLATAHGTIQVEYRHPTRLALDSARSLVTSDSPWDSKKWQARDVILLAEQLGNTRDVACRVDVIGIGRAFIAAAPWQPFCEFGLKIKNSVPDRPVLLATFANGALGYVPTQEAFIGGGYEPTLCRGSKLSANAGEQITGEFIRLLRQLKNTDRYRSENSPGRSTDTTDAGHTVLGRVHEELLSSRGSSRGTAYIENNKILMARGKLHVTWLDAGRGGKEGVQIRTLDLQRGQWSDVFTLGEAHDNHGGPTLARDGKGYLHALFGPHHHPLSYRRSVRPDDASEWTSVEPFGARCTYPSMVCDSDNTLHMVCRDSSTAGWTLMYYYCKEGNSWSNGRPLIESTIKDGKYRCYRGTLFLDGKGVLHLGFMLFGGEPFKDAQTKGLAGYLRSQDAGRTWTHFDETVVKDLPTDSGFERIPVKDNCIRTSNLVVDSSGIPCLVTVSTGFRGYCTKWGEAILWMRRTHGWQASPLNACIDEVYPGYRAAWVEPSISFANNGWLYIALTVVNAREVDPTAEWYGEPQSIYGHSSSRIVMLVSVDGGRTFDARRVGQDVQDVPSWIPCLERFTGHNEIGIPHLIYTHGVTGAGCNPENVVTDIRLVSFATHLPCVTG